MLVSAAHLRHFYKIYTGFSKSDMLFSFRRMCIWTLRCQVYVNISRAPAVLMAGL